MTLKEAMTCCNCNKKEIKFLIEQGILPDESQELSKSDADNLCTAILLFSIGTDKQTVLSYFKGDTAMQIATLKKVRAALLDDIHSKQKSLDKLDFILREKQKD